MGYATLRACIADLEAHGHLKRVGVEVDPYLELAAIQRRLFRAGAPAVLFSRVRGTRFPMLANLFGTRERLRFIFRDSLANLEAFARAKVDPFTALRRPWRLPGIVADACRMFPRATRRAPVLEHSCALADLPRLVCWPGDGGPFVTLPLVYTEDPRKPGLAGSNLGMYRVQLAGSAYGSDEVGVHYQIHRGIGAHHAAALADGRALPVRIFVGGPPCLSVAAVMPLPEALSELAFAGVLGKRRVAVAKCSPLPVLAEADFCISGQLLPRTKPEGPFGDHVGYYSLQHEFPALRVSSVHCREGAVWPFTVVGRPPQEDTVFGEFIHEITARFVPQVFPGICELHAVDCAGVHPLLLALGSERYTPYEGTRRPRELLTAAMHLLGVTQTALAKFVLLAAHEDAPGLTCHDVGGFLRHMLERADFERDLHFVTNTTNDTLDYTGLALHEGSKMIWASAGEKRRTLGTEVHALSSMPTGFSCARVVGPGMLVVRGPAHTGARGEPDAAVSELAGYFALRKDREAFPLVVVADEPDFCAAALENFLWTTFTRADPSTDSYGANARFAAKHWQCDTPLVLDARAKRFHPPVLEEDPDVVRAAVRKMETEESLRGYFS
ncbi:MAG: UbiD family decarboxylase [Desulfovibrio sp.]|jgi:4-hydroxy-3-polyprenylbenzoate decarboxylase|nr:UbiD family decarboxylase [Desulfovibrio sp.]